MANNIDYGPGEDPTPGYYESQPYPYSPEYGGEFSMPGPGWGPGQLQMGMQGTQGGQGRGILNLLALLLGAGGAAGIGQNLFGQPPTTQTIPRLSPQQMALLSGAQGQFGQTGNLLQQLTGMIQRPQIPPALSLLAEQAFQPQLGNLYSQATEAGRQRGFYDAPATSPPGGTILGPGLADLQGQMAQAKLNLYQNQVGNFLRAFQGSQGLGQAQGNLAASLPTQQRQKAPQPSILGTIGQAAPIAGELGKILAAANPPGSGGFWSSLSGLAPWNWGGA